MENLYNSEVLKLEDKELQLRYLLGGLNSSEKEACGANRFWSCDIRCSVTPVPLDERLIKVQKFIENHNISNETFIKLTQSYLRGGIVAYNGNYGNLISELEDSISDYNFNHSNMSSENDLGDEKLFELMRMHGYDKDSKLIKFLEKYSLTSMDFLVLAKTSLNYNYFIVHGVDDKDLSIDLIGLLNEYNLYSSYDQVVEYRKQLEERTRVEAGKGKSLLRRFKDRFMKN